MDKFLTCLCYKDYTALIISGEVSMEDLTTAWHIIITEYNELKNTDLSENKQWSISQELIRLHNHLYLLQVCIDLLSITYNPEIAHSIRKLGYRFKYVSDNPEDYQDQLFRIAEKAKGKFIQIQQYNKELKKLVAANPDITPQYAGFEKRLIAIEEMQHTVYDLATLTVSKFISLENKYFELITALELRAKKA